MKPEYYAIPPLTPAEALEWIERNEEHQFGYCSDGYDACDCAQRFVGVVLGRPGYHDEPKEKPRPLTGFRAEGAQQLRNWMATRIPGVTEEFAKTFYGGTKWSTETQASG